MTSTCPINPVTLLKKKGGPPHCVRRSTFAYDFDRLMIIVENETKNINRGCGRNIVVQFSRDSASSFSQYWLLIRIANTTQTFAVCNNVACTVRVLNVLKITTAACRLAGSTPAPMCTVSSDKPPARSPTGRGSGEFMVPSEFDIFSLSLLILPSLHRP